MKRFALIIGLVLFPLLAFADPSVNRFEVRSVHDGDSCKLYDPRDGVTFNVRIQGVDAPEVGPPPGVSRVRIAPKDLSQPYATESMSALYLLLAGKTVATDCSWGWSFNRRVCRLYIGGMEQTPLQDVGEYLVLEGYAYAVDPFYEPPQTVSQAHRRGIWSLPHQEKPTEYRRRMREFQKSLNKQKETTDPWWKLTKPILFQ